MLRSIEQLPRKKDWKIEALILDLWIGREKKEITYNTIEEAMESQGVSKRTLPRYLLPLVKRGALERTEYGYKRTSYKPIPDFYEEYLALKKRTDSGQEALSEIASYVMDAVNKAIAESKKLSERLYNRVWDEISENTEDSEDNTIAFENATEHIVRQRLKEDDKKTFYRLLERLIQNCFAPLTDRAIFARLDLEVDIPEEVEYQITNLIKAYLTLWDFMYKHPGTVGLLEDILAEDDPREVRAKKQLGRSIKNRAR